MNTQDMSNNKKGWKPTKEEVFAFLQTVPLGVVSTLDESGQPHSATVAFSQTQNLEFIIGTAENSRKAQNIERDDRAAFVATDAERRYTVQMEGTARKLSRNEFDQYAEAHFEKLPQSAPFRDMEGQCYILISPNLLRFTDCNVYPWEETEYTFTKPQV